MKKQLLFAVTLLLTCSVKAQNFNINFELPDSLVTIDTPLTGNVWQTGVPGKIYFDSAYSVPNAIVTDTLNYYPDSNLSSFTIKVFDPAWGFGGGWSSIGFAFWHKYDFDSLQDGGYVEVLWDSGTTWSNIVNEPNIQSSAPWFGAFYYGNFGTHPVISNGNEAYTGNSAGWQYGRFGWCGPGGSSNVPIYLRFVFSSDSIHSNREGWMIDNIEFFYTVCEGIKEQQAANAITIYPNPAHDYFTISRSDVKDIAQIQIYDAIGKLVFENNSFTGESISAKQFIPGVYLLKYSDNKRYCVKKFVME